MKKRTRRILFWLAAVIFAVASWASIRYAQGYAYDFDEGKFVRTGAVAISANASGDLFVDERRVGNTSFIGNRVGQEGLLPGAYTIRFSRDGYTSWRKSITVEEGLLTDFPHVMVLPTDDESLLTLKAEASNSLAMSRTLKDIVHTPTPSPAPRITVIPKPTPGLVRMGDFALQGTILLDERVASASVIAENVLGFSVAENNSRILWWSRNELWVMWLRNTDQQPYRSEGDRQAITRFSVPVQRAAWFRDTEHLVADLGNQSYRIIETDSRGGTNIIKL